MACRQTRGLIALLLGSFLILASLGVRAQPADAPPGETNAYQFRALTVQVRSARTDKPDETVEGGYGFVVARHGDVLTIVTADHVVRDQDGIVYGKVTVEPYVSRGHPLPADVLDFQMPRDYGDMAVLEVHRSNFPALPPVPVAKLPIAEGTEAWRIGKEQGWTPSNRPGVFVGRQKTIWLGFDNLDAPRGSSGGPILTNDGLIGMVTDDQSGRGYVLPVDTIIDFLTGQGAPWDLADPRKAPTPPSPPTTGAPPSTTPPTPPARTAPAVPNFAGAWVEISPSNPDHPFKLQIAQSGSQLTFAGGKLVIVDGVATRTSPQGCAPQFQKPGFDYNGPNLAGPNTLTISISGQVLTYEITVNWLAPCDGHPKGIEKTAHRLRPE
jgi:hypothetical protein